MQPPPLAILLGAILVLVVFAAGYAGLNLSMNSPIIHPVEGETNSPFHLLTPTEGRMIVLDEADDDQMYSISRNTQFLIILPETLAHGYSWNGTMTPGLSLLNTQYVADPNAPRFDINGTHIWMLQANGTGQQEFSAAFVQGNGPLTNTVKRYTVKVSIVPES